MYVYIYAGKSTLLQRQNAADYEAGIHVTNPYQLYFEVFVYGGERNMGAMGPDLMSPRAGYLIQAGGMSLDNFLDDKFKGEGIPDWRMNAFPPQVKGGHFHQQYS